MKLKLTLLDTPELWSVHYREAFEKQAKAVIRVNLKSQEMRGEQNSLFLLLV